MKQTPARWTAYEKDLPAASSEECLVLVVEDDADARANLAEILESDGHRVHVAGSAEEALAFDGWNRVATVILDRKLPEGDSLELLPGIRQLAPDVGVIMVTALSDLEGAVSALRQGVTDYLLKPISPDALRIALLRVSQQRATRRALKESREQLRQERDFVESLLETVPTLVLLVGPRGNVIRFNSQLEELTGYSAEAVRGRNCLKVFLAPSERRRLKNVLRLLAKKGSVEGVMCTLQGNTGRDVEIRWSARVLRDAQGVVQGVLAGGQDVTELRKAQENVLQSARLAAIGQAMAGLVHESRNALQRCQACLEMLAAECADRPRALELVKRIERAQSDLHQLFEEVREYAAPLRLHPVRCDISSIWRKAWIDLSHEREEKRLRLVESCGDCATSCEVDGFAMGQAFRNLLENAIQASPPGGEVRIACEETLHGGHEELRVSIRDQGPGIPAPLRSQVLQPFFTTKTKGTGLGLPIAQRIVDSHGGRLWIGEESHQGAEIVLQLPVRQS